MNLTANSQTAYASLHRILRHPILILSLFATQFFVVHISSIQARWVTRAALDRFSWQDEGNRLRTVVELLNTHPSIIATILVGISVSVLVGAFFWAFTSPGNLLILNSKKHAKKTPSPSSTLSQWASACAEHCFSVALQSLWYNLVRILGFALILILSFGQMQIALPFVFVVYVLNLAAYDQVRASLVVESKNSNRSPQHPIRYFIAFLRCLKNPKRIASVAALTAASWGLIAFSFWNALAELAGPGSIALSQLCSLFVLILGLWRLSLPLSEFDHHSVSKSNDEATATI